MIYDAILDNNNGVSHHTLYTSHAENNSIESVFTQVYKCRLHVHDDTSENY